jgi:hypothetical protein
MYWINFSLGSTPESIDDNGTTTGELIRSVTIDSDDEQVNNIELIDISSVSTSSSTLMKCPLSRIGGHDDSDLITGRIGEQMVYEYLLYKYRHQSNSVSIKWENHEVESHLPYDILLTKNGKKHYIEVKSTRTNNQNSFQLSIYQIEAILEHKEYYFIYRVYIEENKLIILDNVRWRLKNKQQLTLASVLTIESTSQYQIIYTDD